MSDHIVWARTPRAVGRFLRTARAGNQLGLVAGRVLASLAVDGGCFVVDTHVVRLVSEERGSSDQVLILIELCDGAREGGNEEPDTARLDER